MPREAGRRVAAATERRRGSPKGPFSRLLTAAPEKRRPTSITYQKKCKNDTFLHFLTKCKQRRHPKSILLGPRDYSHFFPKNIFLHGVGSNNTPFKNHLTPTSFWRQKSLLLAEGVSGLKSRGSRSTLASSELKTHDEFDRQNGPRTSLAWSKSNLKPPKMAPKRSHPWSPRFESPFLKLRKPLV